MGHYPNPNASIPRNANVGTDASNAKNASYATHATPLVIPSANTFKNVKLKNKR